AAPGRSLALERQRRTERDGVRGDMGSGLSSVHSTGRKERGDPLNSAIDKMTKKTRDLRRQLRKAVMDHISDSFLETNVPLLVLIEAAKTGNEKEVKEYAQVFREHANKLVECSVYSLPVVQCLFFTCSAVFIVYLYAVFIVYLYAVFIVYLSVVFILYLYAVFIVYL
ncbi:hypothetical protein QTP86_008227, partial [Hemibagrus guttatus]